MRYLVLLILTIALVACRAASLDAVPPTHDPVGREEQAAYGRARPVFERHCASCHSSAGARARPAPMKHFNMDTYPFTGHATPKTIRRVLGVGGEPTMPPDHPGAVGGDDLEAILSWAAAVELSRRSSVAGADTAR